MLGNRNPDEMQATGGYKSAKGGYKERVGAGGGGGCASRVTPALIWARFVGWV